MATLKDIRKRIGSVKNTQKITKAMKMVAAAKLRRSQQALLAARPYGDQLAALVLQLAGSEGGKHPLFGPAEGSPVSPTPSVVRLIILTSDRGFCGGFNGNLLRRVLAWLNAKQGESAPIELHVIGKKGRDFFKAKGREITHFETGSYDGFNFGKARERAVKLSQDYLSGAFAECYFVYNRFKSAMSQDVTFYKLLPIEIEAEETQAPLVEPAMPKLLDELVPRYLATLIFRFFLESIASEFGARMVAMDGATKNCSEMIDGLTLTANRLRQAAITSELMDIVNGAEAL